MTIFRNRNDGKLYLMYKCSPRGYTGSWLCAVPYFPMCNDAGVKVSASQIANYIPVSHA